ncbi:hypothetical protein CDL12_03124 [Handroanthus impetiginosus]|uniref:Uncharacterized protein n=1 Tax=Handroanthus impetiginosus TaxID=429701 RepID=A0A2G9I347_9LAMI|nr:hypothetical protein CDL12_03124 [Handroanthus impetiginosus]
MVKVVPRIQRTMTNSSTVLKTMNQQIHEKENPLTDLVYLIKLNGTPSCPSNEGYNFMSPTRYFFPQNASVPIFSFSSTNRAHSQTSELIIYIHTHITQHSISTFPISNHQYSPRSFLSTLPWGESGSPLIALVLNISIALRSESSAVSSCSGRHTLTPVPSFPTV